MELANIEKLVEKYENAETSLQEEAILKNYFTKEDVAPHLQEYKFMFAYFNTAKAEKIYADLTNGLKLLSTNLKKGEQAVATLYTVEDKVNEALK